jgi:hypothetical protein
MSLNELERRLLRLQGSGGSTKLETSSLQTRLRNLQEPENLRTHTLESLQHKFSSIFGQPEVHTMPTPSTTTAVDIYLAAVQEQDDWQEDEWNSSSSSSSKVNMAQQAFLGSNSGIDLNDVSILLAQAHDAVRLSAQPSGATYNSNNNDYDEDDEDDEVAAIIQASKEEVLLDNKYGKLVVPTGVGTEEHRQKKKEHKKNTEKKKKKKKKKNERKKKKHQRKKKRNQQSSFSSDSASSDYTSTSSDSSQSSSVSSDSSSDSDNVDNHSGGRRKRKRNKTKNTADTAEGRDVVNSFKQEEADTLNRLREAVRNEGRDSDLVRLLAQKLVQLRKLEKKRLYDEVTSLKFKNKFGIDTSTSTSTSASGTK